jgi:uncharacterized protein YbjT (DUF2867 family)
MSDKLILVTGATGYVGGRLIPWLLEKGYPVRAMVRDPERLQGREWSDKIDMVAGDVLKPETLAPALQGVDTAYYLIHSMSGSGNFQERDLQAARNFGTAAKEANVRRIIYLGGLGDPKATLSEHLRSRQESGEALRESGLPVTEFRAAIVVGSGSVSFEMIRYLTERVPVMICPQWVYTRVQPISIRNLLEYLVAALDKPESDGEIIEIGGENVLTYGDMMLIYARVRDLRRYMIAVPVLTPRLSSYWVHLVTPIPSTIAQPLIEGLRNEVVVRNDLAHQLFPDIQPMNYEAAVRLALNELNASQVETRWSDSLSSSGDTQAVILDTHEGMMIEQRQWEVNASPKTVFNAFSSLGGQRGWLYFNWAWRIRGILDWLVGGVGYRRGRRHATQVWVGDAFDFWRVEAVEPDQMIRLRAEMKLPGRGWLQFKSEAMDGNKTRLTQTAFFAPRGFFGLVYWYGLYPIHRMIFSGMIRSLAAQAENPEQTTLSVSSIWRLGYGAVIVSSLVTGLLLVSRLAGRGKSGE